MAWRLGKYTNQLGGPLLHCRAHATCIHYTFRLFMLASINILSNLRTPKVRVPKMDWISSSFGSSLQRLKIKTRWLQIRSHISPNKSTPKGWNTAWNKYLIPRRRPSAGPLQPTLASLILDSHPKSKPGRRLPWVIRCASSA